MKKRLDCVKELEKCGVEYLHIDVMDGDFVPNFTLGPDYVRALRGMTSIPVDLHLMVRKPELHIASFGLQKGDIVSVHWESTDHMQRTLCMIRDCGATPAVALNPATPIEVLEYVLDDIGMVLVMTVNPGFAGQKLVPQTLRKIEKVREFLAARGRDDVEIEADGNVSFENARLMRAAGVVSLSNADEGARRYWIEHVKRCRSIAAEIGRRQGSPCVNNLWISDGSKDICVDKIGLRRRLKESLDEIYAVKYGADVLTDSVESKLFGIGTESFVVGSLEFYLAYALQNGLAVCFDMGHFHPTESVADKLSAVFLYMDKVLLHVSRGVRWDSDHVVLFNDETRAEFQEIHRAEAYDKAIVAVDYFDASINRVFAWAIGMRAAIKGILYSLLEPTNVLLECEHSADLSRRLALIDEIPSLPFGAVWDYYCESKRVPIGERWTADASEYEKRVMSKRK